MQIALAGALGEVGTSLSSALQGAGHVVVPVTSRPLVELPAGVLSVVDARDLITSGLIDLVVNAAGPGDRRPGVSEVRSEVSELAAAAALSDVPAVLISTLRVCEGVAGLLGDDTVAQPLTPYARSNSLNEESWLSHPTAMVLRMVNYFCPPQGAFSPQAQLLPWSLLIEGWRTGHIEVRSGLHAAKTFVDAADVASAILLMADGQPYGRRLVTMPGVTQTMGQLVRASLAVLAQVDCSCTSSFGSEAGANIEFVPAGWLAQRGWSSSLSLAAMQQQMHGWLVEWGSHIPGAGEGRY